MVFNFAALVMHPKRASVSLLRLLDNQLSDKTHRSKDNSFSSTAYGEKEVVVARNEYVLNIIWMFQTFPEVLETGTGRAVARNSGNLCHAVHR